MNEAVSSSPVMMFELTLGSLDISLDTPLNCIQDVALTGLLILGNFHLKRLSHQFEFS
jgi:hypothetical protein